MATTGRNKPLTRVIVVAGKTKTRYRAILGPPMAYGSVFVPCATVYCMAAMSTLTTVVPLTVSHPGTGVAPLPSSVQYVSVPAL